MPMLKHFTPEQAEEVRSEIHMFLRPYRIRFWLVLIGLVLGLVFGFLAYQSTENNTSVQAKTLSLHICTNLQDSQKRQIQLAHTLLNIIDHAIPQPPSSEGRAFLEFSQRQLAPIIHQPIVSCETAR